MGCHFHFTVFVIVVELTLSGKVFERMEPFVVKYISMPLISMKEFIFISLKLFVIYEANERFLDFEIKCITHKNIGTNIV